MVSTVQSERMHCNATHLRANSISWLQLYIVNTLFLRQVSLWSFRLSPLAGTNMHLVLVEEDVCC